MIYNVKLQCVFHCSYCNTLHSPVLYITGITLNCHLGQDSISDGGRPGPLHASCTLQWSTVLYITLRLQYSTVKGSIVGAVHSELQGRTVQFFSCYVLYVAKSILYIPRYCSLHCTLYTIHGTLYSVHYTVYSVHCTLYTVHCTWYSVHCKLYTVQCTLYTDQASARTKLALLYLLFSGSRPDNSKEQFTIPETKVYI